MPVEGMVEAEMGIPEETDDAEERVPADDDARVADVAAVEEPGETGACQI